jgi:hypothetical protein
MNLNPSYGDKARGDRGMAITGSCVSKMEKSCFSIIPSPESATLLYARNTRKRHSGRLAGLAYRRCGKYITHGQRHCSTWEQSRMSSPLGPEVLAAMQVSS